MNIRSFKVAQTVAQKVAQKGRSKLKLKYVAQKVEPNVNRYFKMVANERSLIGIWDNLWILDHLR